MVSFFDSLFNQLVDATDDWEEVVTENGSYWYSASTGKTTAVGDARPAVNAVEWEPETQATEPIEESVTEVVTETVTETVQADDGFDWQEVVTENGSYWYSPSAGKVTAVGDARPSVSPADYAASGAEETQETEVQTVETVETTTPKRHFADIAGVVRSEQRVSRGVYFDCCD